MRPEHHRRRGRSIAVKTCVSAIVVALVGAACTSLLAIKDPVLEDAGDDAATDAAGDGGSDGLVDSAIDGHPAQCTAGACCSASGMFEPATKVCATTTDFQCSGASNCGGQPQQRMTQQFCSGTSASCDGQLVPGSFTNLGAACTSAQLCSMQSAAAPQCTPCPFGCDTAANTCQAPKLWVFVTDAIFTGAFGATNGGRVTADAKCQDKYNASFTARGCTLANVHAVIQIDDTLDSLDRMASMFSIPTTAEVFRATDARRVSTSWNTFVDPNAVLIAPVVDGSSSVPFWSGRGLSSNHQCTRWTATASVGDTGDAITVNKWTSQGATPCGSLVPHLLCACW